MALREELQSFPPSVNQARVLFSKAAQSSVDLTRSIVTLTDKLLQVMVDTHTLNLFTNTIGITICFHYAFCVLT